LFRQGESQILDYQTQQYKLLPYIAYTYAFRFSSAWLQDFYVKFIADIDKGNIGQLADVSKN
jgi:acyl-CoA oxidase